MVDEHSSAVTRAYRTEESRLRGRDLRRQHMLLDALLSGHGADPEVLAEAEAVLELRRDGRFLVVLAAFEPASGDALRQPHEALARRGVVSWWRVRAGREVGLVQLPAAGPEDALDLLRSCAVGRAAVSPTVTGVTGLPDAARLAETVLVTLPPDHVGLVQVGDRLPEALLVAAPRLADLLVEQVLAPVMALPAQEREALLRTLEEVVHAGGSLSRAATVLFCHRNTVLNRMQRLERLTGRALAEPRDHLMLALAVLAVRLPGRSSGPTPD